MAEQTFLSPGFFEQEIELIAGAAGPQGTPAGLIGPAEKGPAFVPVTVGNFVDFTSKFGGLSPDLLAPYAAREWLKHKGALTYVRTLGAGANNAVADIVTTQVSGTVRNSGFKIVSEQNAAGGDWGDSSVQFIVANHYISSSSPSQEQGYPIFTDNPSYGISYTGGTSVNLVRAALFSAADTRIQVMPFGGAWSETMNDAAYLSPEDVNNPSTSRKFKLVISSSAPGFSSTDGYTGLRILTASLDPNDDAFVAKILNTDPDLFGEKKHLLYLDFSVDQEVAPVAEGSVGSETIAILSGTANYIDKFGNYATRYTTPRTSDFISQPYGKTEYDLFHFETISDGAWANDKIKVSIANVNASTDASRPWGTFDVQIRRFSDDDIETEIIEAYPSLSLNPKADNYVAKVIGDKKVFYNFDSDDMEERRLVIQGKYPNRSPNVRIVMNPAIETGEIPSDALPFGFRGVPVLKTTDSLKDSSGALTFDGKTFAQGVRLHGRGAPASMTYSVVPPMPFRFKVTRGEVQSSDLAYGNIGLPGVNERADSRYYWGVMNKSVPSTGSVSNAILNANLGVMQNPIIDAYTKFQGIAKQDVLVSGSAADVLNANKFTLARVALSSTAFTNVTGTADAHMREAAYVRDGVINSTDYTVNYGAASGRLTMASLVHSSSVVFNRFTPYMKFTNIFYGGFDGLNILDRDNRLMNDRASSTEASTVANGGSGKARGDVETGLLVNAAGEGNENNIVAAYKTAVGIITDEFSSNVNLFAIPGIREPLVTNYASDKARANSLMMYVMDIPAYDDTSFRLWDGTSTKPSVRYTSETFVGRGVDNNYTSTYFPDVHINDEVNGRRVIVPSSVAVLGAMAFNDKVSYPWFAPAGFNRGALDFVTNAKVRLNSGDRDTLYSARINPIAVFPTGGYVIFGQKTLQLAKTALDRVNVRRLMIEVKRVVAGIANGILFEQNTPATRAKFVTQVTPRLALIQAQAGIEKFRVVMDETNNTTVDVENNRVNGKIIVVPTKAVEFISIDFVITNSGVQFE